MIQNIIIFQDKIDLLKWADLYTEIEPIVNRSEEKVAPGGETYFITPEQYPNERSKVYETERIAEKKKKEFCDLAVANALKVGDGITVSGYSDQQYQIQ